VLERLVGGNPDAPEARRFSGEHQKKLREMIERIVLAPSAEDHNKIAERQWREEQQAFAAAAASPDWQPASAGGDGLAADSSHAAERSSADGDGSSASPAAAPVSNDKLRDNNPTPAPPPLSDVESMRRTNENAAAALQRSGYLKREEPWMTTWKNSPWGQF